MHTRATFAGLLALVVVALVAHGCSDSVTPERSAHRAPAPALDAVPIAGQELYVPPGFNVNLFAEALNGPRSLELGPGGAVFVTLSTAGEIVRLVDVDGDGVADARSTVLSGLAYPFGLAFRGDTMYFAEETAVSRLDPGATTPVTLIPNLPSGGHVSRTIVFGPDALLYLAIGSSCNVCDDPLPRAAVTRYNLDGSNPHTFATGLRNSVGLAFHPTTGELWANNNDRDNLGDDLPPERVNILRDGKWYGWPQCYLPGQANPEYPGADCSGVEPPAITFQAHSAPLGLAFYTGTMFPAEYVGDAFMAYHGSWNRTVPTGAKVVRVRVVNGQPTAIEDFVTGWQLADGSRWGRPVGLLVSDDLGGRIWRVSFGPRPGNLNVTATTTGPSQPVGYTVTVDGVQSQTIGATGSVTFTNVSAGDHSVALTDVPANCTVSDPNPRPATVPSGGTVTASFSASCADPNQPPIVTAGPDETAMPGIPYTLSGASFSDPDNDGPWSYTIDWGDGSSSSNSTSTQGSLPGEHTYLLPGTYLITVTVTDARGASGSGSKVLTVGSLPALIR